jgi:hypothetical protein
MSGGYFMEQLKHETKERCFVCERNGEEPAQLHSYGVFATLVGFWGFDPPHDHDDNCHVEDFGCEKGHRYSVRKRNTCPACDWKGIEECFCHPLGVRIFDTNPDRPEWRPYKDGKATNDPPPWTDIVIPGLERVNRVRH